ncbi:beta-1,3-galactosyltransferase 6-like [Mizuhopecten yessoensis]|uniref:Hexosyltransferase n=1 Tax=Mizuhopecten yessoensis TaxID=6573 RepID=A0A210R518_MIZYE|nr:beta-1,3-galactosyltransferase 6-like [Mizuhopecten yessoensis]OWF56163.1 Beta-1,3-galactosyltransferase 6 [Mizuhopecten yessoensis]
MRSSSAQRLERKLNKHAMTILIGGIFLSFSALMYLSFCHMPCEDPTYAVAHNRLKEAQNEAYWSGNMLSPRRKISVFLAVIIPSAPGNARQRDVVRETWGNDLGKDSILRFIIGTGNISLDVEKELQRENLLHKDLVLLKLNDSFVALTKKMLETFKWLDSNVDFKFVLKADEDTFVQVDKFKAELQLKPKEQLYWGFFDGRATVKKMGKWPETDWKLCDRYLPYALGGGYVLSSDLVHYIASNSKMLKLFNNEDVSVGAWLGPLDIQRQHDPRFDTEYVSRGCQNVYLVTHKHTNIEMREFKENIKKKGKLCTKEFQLRLSYIYNWNGAPSRCCQRIDDSIP